MASRISESTDKRPFEEGPSAAVVSSTRTAASRLASMLGIAGIAVSSAGAAAAKPRTVEEEQSAATIQLAQAPQNQSAYREVRDGATDARGNQVNQVIRENPPFTYLKRVVQTGSTTSLNGTDQFAPPVVDPERRVDLVDNAERDTVSIEFTETDEGDPVTDPKRPQIVRTGEFGEEDANNFGVDQYGIQKFCLNPDDPNTQLLGIDANGNGLIQTPNDGVSRAVRHMALGVEVNDATLAEKNDEDSCEVNDELPQEAKGTRDAWQPYIIENAACGLRFEIEGLDPDGNIFHDLQTGNAADLSIKISGTTDLRRAKRNPQTQEVVPQYEIIVVVDNQNFVLVNALDENGQLQADAKDKLCSKRPVSRSSFRFSSEDGSATGSRFWVYCRVVYEDGTEELILLHTGGIGFGG